MRPPTSHICEVFSVRQSADCSVRPSVRNAFVKFDEIRTFLNERGDEQEGGRSSEKMKKMDEKLREKKLNMKKTTTSVWLDR